MLKKPLHLIIAVVALLALTGGTATAAKLITGKSVKNSSLTGADLKNSSLTGADLKNGSVGTNDLSKALLKSMKAGKTGATGPQGPAGPQGPQGPAGTPDGYTKGEADGRFLGAGAKAADAEKVDGIDGDKLVGGDAQVGWNAFTRGANTSDARMLQLGDMGELRVTCGAGGAKTITFRNETFDSIKVLATTNPEGADTIIGNADVAPNADANLQNLTADYSMTVTASRTTGNLSEPRDFSTVLINAVDDAGACTFHAQAIDNESDGGGLQLAP